MRKLIAILAVLVIASSVATAKMDRTLYTKENRFPELYRPEIGVLYEYSEMNDRDKYRSDDDSDLSTANIFTRIRPLEDLNLRANVPLSSYSANSGGDHKGIGDITVGADLIAYQDIFDYPFVIPHIDYTFDTGDEDKNLGKGESFTTVGINLGTIVHDKYHWMLDLGYRVHDETENAFVIGASFLWELSDQFAAIAETQFVEQSDGPTNDDDDFSQYYTGGFSYSATENLSLAIYGTGTADDAKEDVIISVKASLSL